MGCRVGRCVGCENIFRCIGRENMFMCVGCENIPMTEIILGRLSGRVT